MDTEALKSLLSDFDFSKFVPELDTVLGWLEMITRIAVMAGPILMLGLGLLYLLAPPKARKAPDPKGQLRSPVNRPA